MNWTTYVERRFNKWLTEQPLNAYSAEQQKDMLALAIAEISAEGFTSLDEARGFDLEGIWER